MNLLNKVLNSNGYHNEYSLDNCLQNSINVKGGGKLYKQVIANVKCLYSCGGLSSTKNEMKPFRFSSDFWCF